MNARRRTNRARCQELPGAIAARAGAARGRATRRRGVTGVLSMMFLVLFSSLAVAMAVVSQGNLRTAQTHLHVTRALGAVDTGLEIAGKRLQEAAERFVVAKGEIDPDYAQDLWYGTYSGEPAVTVLPPADGREEDSEPAGILDALLNHHAADSEDNVVASIEVPEPPEGWLATPAIGVAADGQGNIVTAVQINYLPPDDDGRVLVVVTGYDWDWNRGQWITRTAQQHYGIAKQLRHAILSPSRILMGRNVQINGPLGVAYDSAALNTIDDSPLVMHSDFYGLDNDLDDKLNDLYSAVLNSDVDGDNRMRVNHAVESAPLSALNAKDYDNDDAPDNAFTDKNADGAVDDFDLFLDHFDANGDGRVALSDALREGTSSEALAAEFELDDALAELIDSGLPDRNGNGRFNGRFYDGAWDSATTPDNNGDGVIDSADIDADDVVLGYRDGVLDYRDRYAKVRGSIRFRAARDQWESATDDFGEQYGDYQQFVEGPIRTAPGEQPVSFEADESEVPTITQDSFAAATEALIEIADSGDSFQEQVEAAKGNGYTPPTVAESTPYGAPAPADWYQRPVYEGITFRDVVIPMGTNALFVDCTFVGVTRIEYYADNTHPSWVFYGEQQRDPETGELSFVYPPPPESSEVALDQSYSEEGAEGYEALPEPLVVEVDLDGDGEENDVCYNTKLLANNIRFHDCLFVGSLVTDTPTVYSNIRNKLQFTGATGFSQQHPEYPDDPDFNPDADDLDEIAKSSLMAPNVSVDIGTNNSPPDQNVNLRGAVIAGVIDLRGNVRIDGVLLATYEPVYGEAPLLLYDEAVGNPADFNISLGYFSPDQGDEEGIDLSAVTDLDADGTPDIGWDTARDADGNMIPLASFGGTHDDAWYDGIPDSDAEIDPGVYVRRGVHFNGFGRVVVNWDPNLVLPDGLATPISIVPVRSSYSEGKFVIAQEGGDDEPEGNTPTFEETQEDEEEGS